MDYEITIFRFVDIPLLCGTTIRTAVATFFDHTEADTRPCLSALCIFTYTYDHSQ